MLKMDVRELLYAYIAHQVRHLFHSRPSLYLPINIKWRGLAPASYNPNWMALWHPGHSHKEAVFLWSIYHKAIVVNHWRSVDTPGISHCSPCCSHDVSETIHHAFFKCEAAQSTWEFANTILQVLLGSSRTSMSWEWLTMEQWPLGMDMPAHLLELQRTWSLLHGSVLWTLWLRRNVRVFTNVT